MKIIHSEKYNTGYPSGPIVFLNKWKDATVRYNRVAEPGGELRSSQLIDYLSIGFMVINDTENIIEQAKDNTSTFDESMDGLRKKLSQRDYLHQRESSSIKHIHYLNNKHKKIEILA